MRLRRWIRPVAVALAVLLGAQSVVVAVAPSVAWADDGGAQQDPRDPDYLGHQWNMVKNRFNKWIDSPGDFIKSSMFFLGLWPACMLFRFAADVLCDWFGWWCPDDNADDQPPGADEPYCADSTGTPITDRTVAQKCCSGPKLQNTRNPPHPDCVQVFPPEEIETFPNLVAAAEVQAVKELSHARSLIGDSAVVEEDGDDPALHQQTEAATAGGVLPEAKPASGDPAGTSGGAPAAPTRSGGGPRGGGGGGLGGDFGNLKTAPADGLGGGASPTPDPSASLGGSYQNGAGAAQDGGSGGGMFGRGFGSGNEVEGAGGSDEQDFGSASGGTEQVSIGDDPADYFTRIGIEDDLFKIVERRYFKKSGDWIREELGRPKPAH